MQCTHLLINIYHLTFRHTMCLSELNDYNKYGFSYTDLVYLLKDTLESIISKCNVIIVYTMYLIYIIFLFLVLMFSKVFDESFKMLNLY